MALVPARTRLQYPMSKWTNTPPVEGHLDPAELPYDTAGAVAFGSGSSPQAVQMVARP
jgi:hypothetical protein